MKLIATVVAFVFSISSTLAGEWFAAPNGTRDNDGTKESPWSAAAALSGNLVGNRVEPGDTIYLGKGTYQGNFRYEPPDTEHKSLTIMGEPGTSAQDIIIDGQNSGRVLDIYDWSDGNVAEIRIDGITVQKQLQKKAKKLLLGQIRTRNSGI
jgi:hypothetical protein